jgi:hypothetical protein
MPNTGTESTGQYWEPVAQGPVAQVDLLNTDPNLLAGTPTILPTTGTIAAAGNWSSGVVYADGFKAIAVGCTSSQAGAITIQRYLDRLGTVPVGALASATLIAATPQWLTVNDGLPFQSFKMSITNTGGSAAIVTNFGALLSAN